MFDDNDTTREECGLRLIKRSLSISTVVGSTEEVVNYQCLRLDDKI